MNNAENPSSRRVVIIGAGMSGLVAAFELLDRARRRSVEPPPDLLVLEASSRLGGNIQTERDPEGGYLCEWGPEGFLDNVPETLSLVERIGKDERLLHANPEAKNRYIARDGRLRRVPTSPPAFLFSDILPLGQRLRVFREPWAPGPEDPERDETVFEFASRRIGPGAASALVDAMVSGVYAGDARALSLKSAFPKMHTMERQHGSLVKAMIAKGKEARKTGRKRGGPAGPGGTITSFRSGMEELIEGLAAAVGDKRVRLNSPVASLSREGSAGKGGRARVVLESGESIDADIVLVTTPSDVTARFVRDSDPDLARPLDEIPFASIAVVVTGHRRADVAHPLDGFGFLIPRSEGKRSLGTLWPSSTFVGRAPAHHCLLRTMVGGATDPEAVQLDDDALLDLVAQEIYPLLAVRGEPVWWRIFRYPRGIAQYTVGHEDRLERIRKSLTGWENLYLAGTSYRGIAVNSICERTPALADAILDRLAPGSGAHTESLSPSGGQRLF